ncbi:MAG: DUF222 domain-containing protein [Gaiellales bacterium]
MVTTVDSIKAQAVHRENEHERRGDELAALSAHLAAATARWLELAVEMRADGSNADFTGFIAWRCGITRREATEYLRVADALHELPATRAAFSRGELSFTKVRALSRVATPASEEGLLELAAVLTASQLERALRAFRRIAIDETRETHEVEFVSYHFAEDGSLYLRARLAAEDGTLLVKALEAARDRIVERRREEQAALPAATGDDPDALLTTFEPPRALAVEALVDLAGAALKATDEPSTDRARVVVHVDADALTTDGRGRSELDDGPVIAPVTARRLGCDAELVTQVERDGLPVSVGRARRTVPPALRRLLEARDSNTCCFPGCERTRHLQAHHRHHWAHGGETSLDNLILLCWHHHRLMHEGGYTLEEDESGGLRVRNRYGVITRTRPPRPPTGSTDAIRDDNHRRDLRIDHRTLRNGAGSRLDLSCAVRAIATLPWEHAEPTSAADELAA